MRTTRRERENHREGTTIYRAKVRDVLSGDRLGRFAFSADTVEEARERGWRLAGRRYGNDIDVRIERASK